MNEEQLPEAPAVNGAAAATMSPSIQNLAVALVAAQTDLPKLAKDKENPFFHSKYAGLDTVLPAALKVLSAHGIALLQSVRQDGHPRPPSPTPKGGDGGGDTRPLLLVKTDPRGQGSAIPSARRYAVMSMLGLVAEEDDDGNAASRPAPGRAQRQETEPVRPVGQERPNTMILKFSGKCSECGVLLQAGTEAIYDGKSKTVRHPGDCPDPFDAQDATG